MKCRVCDYEIPEGWDRCPKCGKKIEVGSEELELYDEFIYASAFEELTSGSLHVPTTLLIARTIGEAKMMLGRERVDTLLATLYRDEGMSITEIAGRLDKTRTDVHRHLRRLAEREVIKMRPPITPKHQGVLVPRKEMERRRVKLINGVYVTVRYVPISPELAYIMGFALGDGSFTQRRVDFYNTEFGFFDEIYGRAKKVAKDLGVSASYFFYDTELKRVEFRADAYFWRILIYSSALSRAMITQDGKIGQQALNVLLQPPFKDYTIAGLWDADGSVYYSTVDRYRYLEMILHQGHHKLLLLEKVAKSLNQQEISTSVPYLTEKMGTTTYLYKRPVTTKEDYYAIRIRAISKPRWIRTVGKRMLHPEKIKYLKS